jgi:hypothetical protein
MSRSGRFPDIVSEEVAVVRERVRSCAKLLLLSWGVV